MSTRRSGVLIRGSLSNIPASLTGLTLPAQPAQAAYARRRISLPLGACSFPVCSSLMQFSHRLMNDLVPLNLTLFSNKEVSSPVHRSIAAGWAPGCTERILFARLLPLQYSLQLLPPVLLEFGMIRRLPQFTVVSGGECPRPVPSGR